jgi:hypothetical protein
MAAYDDIAGKLLIVAINALTLEYNLYQREACL